MIKPDDNVTYQLHVFADAADDAFSAVVYICKIFNGIVSVFLVFGKCRVTLKHQKSFKNGNSKRSTGKSLSGTRCLPCLF